VAKQKWFQRPRRANVVEHWILKFVKTKWFTFIVGIVFGIIIMSLYDKYQTELFMARNQKTIDSLNVEISIKARENDTLIKKATRLDSLLKNQTSDVTNIINNFPSQQRPEIKSSDSAVKFIFQFMRN
jgi:hypothetical protein